MHAIHHCIIVGSAPQDTPLRFTPPGPNMNPLWYTGAEPGDSWWSPQMLRIIPVIRKACWAPQMMDEFRRQAERFNTEINMKKSPALLIFSGPPHKLWTEGEKVCSFSNYIHRRICQMVWPTVRAKLMNKGCLPVQFVTGFLPWQRSCYCRWGRYRSRRSVLFIQIIAQRFIYSYVGDSMRASKIMQERVMNNPAIEIHWEYRDGWNSRRGRSERLRWKCRYRWNSGIICECIFRSNRTQVQFRSVQRLGGYGRSGIYHVQARTSKPIFRAFLLPDVQDRSIVRL